MSENNQNTTALSPLQAVEQGLEKFNTLKAELQKLAQSYKEIKVESLEDKAGLKVLEESRKELKKKRVEIQNAAKALRDPLTAVNRNISDKEKELIDIIKPVEEALKVEEDKWEAEKQRIKQEEERKEQEMVNGRINALLGAGFSYNGMFYEVGADISIDAIQIKQFTQDEFENILHAGAAEKQKQEEEERNNQARFEKHTERYAALTKYLPEEEVNAYGFLADMEDKKYEGVLMGSKIIFEEAKEKKKKEEEETERLKKEELQKLALQKEEQEKKEEEQKIQQKKLQEEAVKLYNEKVDMRREKLISMGLMFNGSEYRFGDVVFLGEVLGHSTPEEWKELISKAETRIREIKEANEIEEQKKKLANERIISRSAQLKEIGLSEFQGLFQYKACPQSKFDLEMLAGLNDEEWPHAVSSLREAIALYEKQIEQEAELKKDDKQKLQIIHIHLRDTIFQKEMQTEEGRKVLNTIHAKLKECVTLIDNYIGNDKNK